EIHPLEPELSRARQEGVQQFLVPGVSPENWEPVMDKVRSLPGIWGAPGIHPQAADRWNEELAERLQALLNERRVVAIGEIGLDKLLSSPSREIQEQTFRAQLRIARSAGMPVLIHCRKAWRRTLDILKEE